MIYLVSFIEGVITFVSPCILPLLPVYVAYFLGGTEEKNNRRLLLNASSFILGFTVVFVLLGVLAGFIGGALLKYPNSLQVLTGIFVVIFGVYFLGLFPERWFQGRARNQRFQMADFQQGVSSFFLFGIIFAVAWSPCLGAFLGSALSLASHQGTVLAGALMLFVYSLGLGLPFLLSAFLLESFKSVFTKLKAHYLIINRLSGLLLIGLGLLMMSGWLNKLQLWLL